MLTDARVRRIRPDGSEVEIEAGKCPGLRLRVKPSGAKSWTLRYRTPAGQRRVTLGRYPAMGLGKARKQGLGILARVAAGEDPSAARKEDRRALRVRDLFGEDHRDGWYLETYVRAAGKLGRAKSPEGIRTDASYIRNHLRTRKALMRKRVDAVTKADLDRIKAQVRPGTWRKLRNILRIAFRHAEEAGVIAPGSSPAARLTATPDRKVERYLNPKERRLLEAAITDAETIGPTRKGGLSQPIARLFRLLALTGMRLGEALDLRWEHVDWRHGQLRLPSSKTGPKPVPLTPHALRFLRRERTAGKVIRVGRVCATNDGGRLDPNNVQRAWRSLRERAGLDGVRIHDLRHSWASDAISAGVTLAVIGVCLGHRSPQTTYRYAHLHNQAIRDGLDRAGAAIDEATQGRRGA